MWAQAVSDPDQECWGQGTGGLWLESIVYHGAGGTGVLLDIRSAVLEWYFEKWCEWK